ncbi:MAG: hypothetical protein LBT29_02530 [Flavobacteriaceae bacterium]|jgi:hypothetical protein|nr:hypothetical protein [Flavobacteriaceae bacterium]
MTFAACLLMTGKLSAQTVFSGNGIYISENAEMTINADKVILDSVSGKGTIRFGKNTKEVIVSDKSVLRNFRSNDETQYLVKVKTSEDGKLHYLVKNKGKEAKTIAQAATSVIPEKKVNSQEEKDATLRVTKVIHTFEKGNPMNGGVVIPSILFITPVIQQDSIHVPNILYTTNESSRFGYLNDYSFCISADILKPPIIV